MSGEGGKRLGGRKWLLLLLVGVGVGVGVEVEVWVATGDKAAPLSGSFLSKASMLTKFAFLSFIDDETDGMGDVTGVLFSRDTVCGDDKSDSDAECDIGVDDNRNSGPFSTDTTEVDAAFDEGDNVVTFDIAANMDRGVDDRIVVAVDDIVLRMVGESAQGLVVDEADVFGDSAPDLDARADVENSGLSNDTVNNDLDAGDLSGETADAGVTGETEFTTDAGLAMVTDSPEVKGVEERMVEVGVEMEERVAVTLGVTLEVMGAPLPEAEEFGAEDTVAAAAASDDSVDDADDDDNEANDKE